MHSTNGRNLLKEFWGGYLAVISGTDGRIDVLRDPSAALSCWFTAIDGGYAFASDPQALVDFGCIQAEIDWPALSLHLFASDLRSTQTCLKGLFELPAGYCATVQNEALRLSSAWSPWEHTKQRPFSDRRTQAEALRQTIDGCVHAWGRAFEKPLLGVSGGLDSSIVATCLKSGDVPFTAFTIATDEAEGDERGYARILTKHLGIELQEGFHRLDRVPIETPWSAHLPRPIGHAFGHSLNHLKFSLAEVHGCDAFFSGVGGDNVFCFTQSASPLVDRWRSGGTFSDLRSTLDDICRLTGCSIGQALTMAARRAVKPVTYRFRGTVDFLADTHIDTILSHPWLESPKGALPGKAAHVGMMVRMLGTIDGFDRRRAPDIKPLLSQPIIEACLCIPTWEWIAGGRNRSMVRAAFEARLPRELIDRSSKGGPNSFAFEVIDKFKTTVRERLVTGRLAQNGVVDPTAIAAALSADTYLRAPDHMRISELLEAENWVRHWEAVGRDKKSGLANTRLSEAATGAGIIAPEKPPFDRVGSLS
jgi:asparagine synthase (glutamine-hydrolysing)